MKVVIVEDEVAASENLTYLINGIDREIEVLAVLDSVKSAISYFSRDHQAELVFMDIHLADGLSFEIFEKVVLEIPVIFTTAYDQYTLQAFKVHSIDYLLKPIDPDELEDAINQFKTQVRGKNDIQSQMESLLNLSAKKKRSYKSTLLVSQRDQMVPLKTDQIAFVFIDTGLVRLITFNQQTFLPDSTLEELEDKLDPECFFRLNRQCIINRDAVVNIRQYFNGKLLVSTKPSYPERLVVSKAKAREFKEWLSS